jgi:hypothetical protein
MVTENMVEADTRFTDESEPGKRTKERINPRNVGIIMLIPALFAPIALSLYGEPGYGYYFIMISMLFVINYDTRGGFYIYPTFYVPWGYIDFFYVLSMLMAMSLYAGPRFVFAYQMVRHYKGRTTRKRTLALGTIADCFFLFLMLPSLLLYPSMYMNIVLPIPIALLISLLLLKFRPPPLVVSPWRGLEETDKWWEKRGAAPTVPTPTRTQSAEVKTDEKKPSTLKEGPWWEEEEKKKKSDKEPTSPW